MSRYLSRRSFLKLSGTVGGSLLLSGVISACGSREPGELSFWDRIQGNPRTKDIAIEDSWTYSNGSLILDLSKLPEFNTLGSAVRIEGEILSDPILLVLGDDGNYYAFKNACTHASTFWEGISSPVL